MNGESFAVTVLQKEWVPYLTRAVAQDRVASRTHRGRFDARSIIPFHCVAAEHYRQGVVACLWRHRGTAGARFSLAISVLAGFLASPKYHTRHHTTLTVALEGHYQHLYGAPYAGRTT